MHRKEGVSIICSLCTFRMCPLIHPTSPSQFTINGKAPKPSSVLSNIVHLLYVFSGRNCDSSCWSFRVYTESTFFWATLRSIGRWYYQRRGFLWLRLRLLQMHLQMQQREAGGGSVTYVLVLSMRRLHVQYSSTVFPEGVRTFTVAV